MLMHNHLQLVKGCNFRLKSIDGHSHGGPSKPSIIFVLFQALIRYLTIGYSKICWLIMMYHTISHDAKVSVCGHRMSGQWPGTRVTFLKFQTTSPHLWFDLSAPWQHFRCVDFLQSHPIRLADRMDRKALPQHLFSALGFGWNFWWRPRLGGNWTS